MVLQLHIGQQAKDSGRWSSMESKNELQKRTHCVVNILDKDFLALLDSGVLEKMIGNLSICCGIVQPTATYGRVVDASTAVHNRFTTRCRGNLWLLLSENIRYIDFCRFGSNVSVGEGEWSVETEDWQLKLSECKPFMSIATIAVYVSKWGLVIPSRYHFWLVYTFQVTLWEPINGTSLTANVEIMGCKGNSIGLVYAEMTVEVGGVLASFKSVPPTECLDWRGWFRAGLPFFRGNMN
ncbi:hypothetical protein J6590_096635 [Homalodisca vitripennis]|nr:hypothetical protein J6590_096635 [Homalodisca vitripennis]